MWSDPLSGRRFIVPCFAVHILLQSGQTGVQSGVIKPVMVIKASACLCSRSATVVCIMSNAAVPLANEDHLVFCFLIG